MFTGWSYEIYLIRTCCLWKEDVWKGKLVRVEISITLVHVKSFFLVFFPDLHEVDGKYILICLSILCICTVYAFSGISNTCTYISWILLFYYNFTCDLCTIYLLFSSGITNVWWGHGDEVSLQSTCNYKYKFYKFMWHVLKFLIS